MPNYYIEALVGAEIEAPTKDAALDRFYDQLENVDLIGVESVDEEE